MKQSANLLRQRIDTDEVRTFEKVAAITGQSQIVGSVIAAMLSHADVFDMECRLNGMLR